MALTAITANVCFIAAYVFYITQVLSLNSGVLMKEAYLAPAAVYAILALFSFLAQKASKEKYITVLADISPALFAFLLLFLTPLFVKVNMPSPHNFVFRKLGLILGISYTAFVFLTAALTVWRVKKTILAEDMKAKKVFYYILAFFFVFNFSLALWFNYANEPTGDEPVYILTAISILNDHDIDLRNNYTNGDYKSFYSRDLKPQDDDLNVNGKMYTKHPIMLSVLIAPFYLLAGVPGISTLMCFFSALLVALMFYLNYRVNKDMESSITAALLAGFTMPVIMFINLTSTDILCAVILAASYIIYRFKPERVLLFSFIMASAIWIHIRIVPIYAVIALLFLVRHRDKPFDILKFGLVQALSFAAFFGINYFFYRDFIPYSSQQADGMQFGAYFLKGLFVYFFDRQLGLFSYGPFYIICIPGMYFLYKRSAKIFVELTMIFIPYYVMIAAYPYWGWGSSSPRYLLPLIFILVVAAAETISAMRSVMSKNIFYLLSAASLVISFAVAAVPWFRWDRTGHENWLVYLLSQFTSINFSIIFPSLINMNSSTVYALAFWVIFAAVVTIVNIFEKNKIRNR
jgi:hypothetical protein